MLEWVRTHDNKGSGSGNDSEAALSAARSRHPRARLAAAARRALAPIRASILQQLGPLGSATLGAQLPALRWSVSPAIDTSGWWRHQSGEGIGSRLWSQSGTPGAAA